MEGYKVLVTYNFLTHRETEYRRFIIQQWLPAMQAMGFEPGEVLHTQWGKYPTRLIVLYASSLSAVSEAMASAEWEKWNRQLRPFVTNLRFRVVKAQPWLQF